MVFLSDFSIIWTLSLINCSFGPLHNGLTWYIYPKSGVVPFIPESNLESSSGTFDQLPCHSLNLQVEVFSYLLLDGILLQSNPIN